MPRFNGGVGGILQTTFVDEIGDSMEGQLTVTIADAANTTAITLTQNDTTNNPVVLSIVNAGTGASVDAGEGNIINVGNIALDSLTSDGTNITITPTGDTLFADGTGIVIGHTAQITTSNAGEFQVLGTGAADTTYIFGRFSADATGTGIHFVKSRNATIGSNTIVLDNDVVGALVYYPDDGSAGNYDTQAANFRAEVDDGSPAEGDIGMAFRWAQMPGGGQAIRETMRLSAAGNLEFGTAATISNITGDLTINPTDSLNVTLTAADADAFTANDGTEDYYNIDTRIDTSGVHAHSYDTTNPSFANIPTASFTLVNLIGYTSTVTTDADDITGNFATQLHVQRTTLNSDTVSTNYTGIVSSERLRGPSAGTNVILDNMAGLHIEDGGGGGGTETVQHGIIFDTMAAATTNYAITVGSTDADQNLIHVGVTGDPIFAWNETSDIFTTSHGLTITGVLTANGLTIGGAVIGEAELEILDGATVTTAELNIIDGSTSATGTTLADADRVVVNDGGVMVQVALTDFETYFESALDTLSNVTTIGILNSGSITSGFGSIDIGTSLITSGGSQTAAEARTATTDGLTTAVITNGTSYVTVTAGGDANSIITLPTPTPGNIVWLNVGATGYELRSSAPATVAINAGSATDAESAVGANVLVRCVCTSATTWIASTFSTIGTEAALEAAAA